MIKKEVIVNCEGGKASQTCRICRTGLTSPTSLTGLISFSSFKVFTCLCLAVPAHVKWGDGARTFVGQLDFAELLFVFKDVFLQGHEQTLGMFGCHDDATSHFGLRHARQDASEIENEIAWRMRD